MHVKTFQAVIDMVISEKDIHTRILRRNSLINL